MTTRTASCRQLAFHSNRHPELVSGSITVATSRQRLKPQIRRKVSPIRVAFHDQVDLPLPAPVLDLLFAGDGRFHGARRLKEYEAVDRILGSEAAERPFAMLPDARRKVGGYTCVKRASIAACHDVHAGLNVALHW